MHRHLSKHDWLNERQSKILNDLDSYIESALRPTIQFKNIQEIGYLIKPCRVIILPLLTSMIFMGWRLDNPEMYDFSDRQQLKEIWSTFRIHFRNKNFLKYIKSFTIDRVEESELKLVEKILSSHSDVTYQKISRECHTSAGMFEWTTKVIEYGQIMEDLNSLGIRAIEERIIYGQSESQKMLNVFNTVLSNQQF